MASTSLSTIVNPSLSINNTLSPVFNTMSQSISVCRINFINMQQVINKGVDTSSIKAAQTDVSGLAEKLLDVASKAKQGISSVVALSDSMAQTATKVNFMNAGLDETDNIQQKILNSAQASSASFQDTANSVASLGINAKDAFSSSDEVIGFAELVSKQFSIAGDSSGEATSALSQLSQAMGDGVISGDELNSIFAQTPNVIQDIADYLGVSVEKVSEMGANGELTADTLKGAMFSASSDINNQFASIPMTWSDITTKIKNSALGAFAPILTKINEIANSEGVQSLVNGMINGLSLVGNVATTAFDILASAGKTVANNWDLIAPVVYALATAMAYYVGYLAVTTGLELISNGLKIANAIAMAVQTATSWGQFTALLAVQGAQMGLNAALLACPLTWIVLALIVVIAAIYLLVAVVNHLVGTSVSATGIICGVFATLAAFIMNSVIIPMWNKIAMFVNFFANVFTNPVAAIKILFLDMAQAVIGYILSMAKAIETVINNIPGVEVDITSGLDGFYNDIKAASANIKTESDYKTVVDTKGYMDYSNAANAGYKFGEGIDSKISGLFDSTGESSITDKAATTESAVNSLGNIDNNTASGAESSERVADSVEITDEDLKYLRDIAEREIIDRTVFKSLSVNMGGISNTVNSMGDLDGIADYLGDVISQTASASMEGVG